MKNVYLLVLILLSTLSSVYSQNCTSATSTSICFIDDNNSSNINTEYQTVNAGQTWVKVWQLKNTGTTCISYNSPCIASNYYLTIKTVTFNGVPGGSSYINGFSGPPFTIGMNQNGYAQVSNSFSQAGTYVITYDIHHTNSVILNPTGGGLSGTVYVISPCTSPTIQSGPSNVNVTAPAPASFSVVASGGITPYTYQWQYNTGSSWLNVPTSAPYSGVTSASLNISSTSTSMNGYQYRCIVRSGGSCTNNFSTSSAATLTVNSACTPVTFTSNSTSQSVTSGSSTSFSIAANGTAPIIYQWQYNNGSGWQTVPSNTPYSGITTPTLNISAATTSMTGYQYRCVASNACTPSQTSSIGVLTVSSGCTPVSIVSNPVSQSVTSGSSTSFSIAANGTAPITYQWQYNNGSGWQTVPLNTPYSGITTPTLSISAATTGMSGYQYRCVVSNSCTPLQTSSPGLLTVSSGGCSPVLINSSTGNQTVTSGATVLFNVNVSGTSPISYQWQYHNGNGWFNVPANASYSGSATATLNISSATAGMNGYQFRCSASNSCPSSQISAVAILNVSGSCTPPATPQNLTATGVSTSQIQLSWTASTNPLVIGYDIWDCNNNYVAYVNVPNSQYTISGLGAGTTHQYKIGAQISQTCLSAPTNCVAGTTQGTTQPTSTVPASIMSPVAMPNNLNLNPQIYQSQYGGSFPITSIPYSWSFWQRATGGHSAGGGIHGCDDSYAFDCNNNNPIVDWDKNRPVFAVADGYVMRDVDYLGWGGSGYNQVLIKHQSGNNTWFSGYLHMSYITNKKNNNSNAIDRYVHQGDIIGYISNKSPDKTITAHLHFAAYVLDPNNPQHLISTQTTFTPIYKPMAELEVNLSGSNLPSVTIYHSQNGQWLENNFTDEFGKAKLYFFDSTIIGDSILVTANGYDTVICKLDTFILSAKLNIPMLKNSLLQNPVVKFPVVNILNPHPFYTNPQLQTKVKGFNYNYYDVYVERNLGDSLSLVPISLNHLATDTLITFSLTDTGELSLSFRFYGVDTFILNKRIYYTTTAIPTYSLTLSVPPTLIGTSLYMDGNFIKNLNQPIETFILTDNYHTLNLNKNGFRDTTVYVNGASNILVALLPLNYSSFLESKQFNFITHGKVQLWRGVTVRNNNIVPSQQMTVRQYDSSFAFLGLIAKSRKFEFTNNSIGNSVSYTTAILLDQSEILSVDSTYLLNVYSSSLYQKISFDSVNVCSYDSATQKLEFENLTFNNGAAGSQSLTIMKKLYPVANPATLTLNENDSLKIPLSQFFTDPDSIHNDIQVSITGSLTQLNAHITGDSLVVRPTACWSGSGAITLQATHDWLVRNNTVSVFVSPDTLPVITPNGQVGLCAGSNIVLTASPGANYLWSNNATTQTTSITLGGTYTVNVTNVNGCTKTSLPVTVNISQLPIVGISPGGTTSICDGDSLIVSATNNGHYQWLESNIAILNDTMQSKIIFAAGNYTVNFTDSNGCTVTSVNSLAVSIDSIPQPAISPSSPQDICVGQITLLAVIPPMPGVSTQWFKNDTATPIVAPSFSAFMPGSYKVRATGANGCSVFSNVVTVAVHPLPVVSASAVNDTICAGMSTQLTAGGAEAYSWTPASSLNNGNVFNPVATPSAPTIYTVIGRDTAFNCQNSATISISLYPALTISAGNNTTIIPGASTVIGGNPTASGVSPFTYLWTPATGLNDTTIDAPVATPAITTTYHLLVEDKNGCSKTDTIVVTVSSPAGITEVCDIPGLFVYPNPAKDLLMIRVSGSGNYSYVLRDMLGQVIEKGKWEVDIHSTVLKTIPLQVYACGIYLLDIKYGGVRKVIKVTKTE